MSKIPNQLNCNEMTLRVLRIAELTKVIGISRSSIYEKLNPRSPYYDQDFPKPIKLGAASVGWLSTSIEAWISSKIG